MRIVRRALLAGLAVMWVVTPAWADTFGGISSDGQAYLVGKTLVCRPLFVDGAGRVPESDPECNTVKNKKTLRAYGFRKSKVNTKLTTSAHGTSVHLLGRKKTLLVWDAGATVDEVKAIYLSPGGNLLALEVLVRPDAQPDKPKQIVVAFAMGHLLGKRKRPRVKPKNLFERMTVKGRVWEQRIIPCERAGVALTLRKDGEFSLALTTGCRTNTNKFVMTGTWLAKGASNVVLSMAQDDGADEQMPCQVKACENDAQVDCLVCASNAIGFTAQARDK